MRDDRVASLVPPTTKAVCLQVAKAVVNAKPVVSATTVNGKRTAHHS
jgi:hypothetical protein